MVIFQGERANHVTCSQGAEREEDRALVTGLSKPSIICDLMSTDWLVGGAGSLMG